MNKKKKKAYFEVGRLESVDECLLRMEKAGYVPVGKIEKPIYKEVLLDTGETTYQPVQKKIIFEGLLVE